MGKTGPTPGAYRLVDDLTHGHEHLSHSVSSLLSLPAFSPRTFRLYVPWPFRFPILLHTFLHPARTSHSLTVAHVPTYICHSPGSAHPNVSFPITAYTHLRHLLCVVSMIKLIFTNVWILPEQSRVCDFFKHFVLGTFKHIHSREKSIMTHTPPPLPCTHHPGSTIINILPFLFFLFPIFYWSKSLVLCHSTIAGL